MSSESRELWLEDLRTGARRPLTKEGASIHLAWSRDSRQLAFLSRDQSVLSAIDVATGNRRAIWQGYANYRPAPCDWTADATRLLALVPVAGGRLQLAYVSAADGRVQPIADVPPQTNGPQLSPDGGWVTYGSAENGNWDIFVVRTDGSGRTRITDHPSRDMYPAWTPDGRSVVFHRDGSGVWTQGIDAVSGRPQGEPSLVTAQPAVAVNAIDTSGELFLSHRKRTSEIVLFEMASGADAPSRLKTVFPENTGDAWWSADGRRLSFRLAAADATAYVDRDLGTGEERTVRLPAGHATAAGVTRSPAAGALTFLESDENGVGAIREYDIGHGTITTLWKITSRLNPPLSWSPDGSALLASSLSADGNCLHVFRPGASVPQTLTCVPARPFAQWSPDGRQIAYTNGDCLTIVRAAGTASHQLVCAQPAPLPSFGYLAVGGLSWSADARTIAWTVHNGAARRMEVWLVDVATGGHVVWPGEANYAAWPSDPRWSPDNRRIAVTMNYKPEYELFRLTGFLARASANP